MTDMTDTRLTPLAASLPSTVPFVGPEAQERSRGAPFKARLGANESVFGPSPRAIAAMADADHWAYGDPENHALRNALGTYHGIDPSHIMVGEGIDGLLGYLVRLFVAPGDAVVTSLGAYPTFNYHVAGFGGILHTVPYVDDHEDPESLFSKAAKVEARLVYLANPDNPMGTAPQIDPSDPRVIRMRTFSKAYGMAGARVGYAIGPVPVIDAFNKVRNHFGMNRSAQAGAVAALADTAYHTAVLEKIARARQRIAAIATETGLTTLPSATNFVAIDCGRDGAFAKAVLDGLIARGIFVRMPFAAPQNRCIRVSCGTPDDLDLFAAALPEALADARRG